MSLKTDNFKLYKYEDNDIGDLRFINDSMDIIDKGINPFYVATLDSANTYKVTTGLNKTSLANGYSIKVAIPSNSTGAVSITVDSVTVPVKKPNGNAVTNFKQNGVYSLTYYNSVFILASGGGADTVNFTSDKLLTGYSANDSNGEKVNGTMPNKGTVTQSLSANGSLTLPRGYYDSIKVTQSLTTKGATTWTPKTTNQTIASGTYLTGTQTIKGDSNLIASNIISGKSIFGVAGKATIQSLGGLQVKSGKITITKSTASTNLPVSIKGLDFKPKIVVLNISNETGNSPSSGGVVAFAFCYDKTSSMVNVLDLPNYDMLMSTYGFSFTSMGTSTSYDNKSSITNFYYSAGTFSTTIYGFGKSWSGSVECAYLAIG